VGHGSAAAPLGQLMRYDFDMITELCRELGLQAVARSASEVAIELEKGVALVFVNAEREEDSLVGFDGGEWHYHDDLMCSDRHGFHIELGYLDVLTGLADGSVLLCEEWVHGALRERLLVHRDYVDEFRYMQEGEEIRIRRVQLQNAAVEEPRPNTPMQTGGPSAAADRQDVGPHRSGRGSTGSKSEFTPRKEKERAGN